MIRTLLISAVAVGMLASSAIAAPSTPNPFLSESGAPVYDALGDGHVWFDSERAATRACPHGWVDEQSSRLLPKPGGGYRWEEVWTCHLNPKFYLYVDGVWKWNGPNSREEVRRWYSSETRDN